MASVSSLGVGSNLDLSGLLDQLKTAEQQPLKLLQQRQVSFTSKLSAYGQVQSSLSDLQAAAKKLSDPAFFQGVRAVSSASDVLSASASATSAPGSYAVNVTQLAQAQSVVATGQANAKAVIGTGKITIDFGTVSGGTLDPATGKYSGAAFAADSSRTAVDITIDSNNNTLEGIRDAINKAKPGVTASIVNDGSGTPNRLVLTATATGKTSSMRIAVDAAGPLRDLLSHDPSGTQNLKQTAAALNAELTVNGIAVTSLSNSVKESVQGTTLTLSKVGTSNLTVTRDTATVEAAIGDLVKAYNALQTTAKSLTTFNQETKTGAALVGDSTLRNLQVSIRGALIAPQPGSSTDLTVLSAVGVSFQKDGTMAVDSTKLRAALSSNLDGVSKLFSSATGSSAGYGKQLSALVDNLTGTGGALKTATDGINASLKALDKQYTAMSDRVDAKVAVYRAQFTQLDLLVSNMTRTSTYLTQQFAAMDSSK